MKKRVLSFLLIMLMLVQSISTIPLTAAAADGDATYEKVALANIQPTDTVIIVATKSDNTSYAMSNDKGTGSGPLPVSVTISGGTITTSAKNIGWNITNENGNLTIYPAGQTETWLYCTNSNDGVRVGTNKDNKIFTLDKSGYLKNTKTSRYLGVYNTKDWRCYTSSTATNIKDQTFAFYKLQEAKHEHAYAWNNEVGVDGSHTLTCANTDGKCDVLTKTEECTWEDGFCSVCGAAAPECAHPTTTDVAEQPATCTEIGYTAGVQCTVCNQYTSGHEEIKALGHHLVTDAAEDATCTEAGKTEGSHCDREGCGHVEVKQETTPPLGHNYVDGVCERCDKKQPTTLTINRDSFGDASGYDWHAWTATTTTGETISGSGFIYGDAKTSIQMNGSKAGDYIYNTTALPGKIVSITLTKASGTDRNFDILTSDTPFDHKTAASLKGQATDAKKTVTTEGVTWTFETNHKYFAIVIIDESAAYLSSIEITYFVCAHTNTTAIGEPKGATCTEDGITAGEKCADCGEVITAQETIEALGHIDEDNNGYCDRETCNELMCTEHEWVGGEVIEEATCAKTGLQKQHCKKCGTPGEDKVLGKTAHTPVTDDAVPATCTATGLTEGSHCLNCEEVLVAQTETPMEPHNYENGECTVCHDVLVEGALLADFQFGENGNAVHDDGAVSNLKDAYISGTYKLVLNNPKNVYGGAFDAKGNSALKLGTSSKAASFTFTVDSNVNTVVIYIAGYKADEAKININGTGYTITSKSNEGDYTKIVVDTSTTKTVTLTTLSGGYRAMVNSIEFWGVQIDKVAGNTVTFGDNIGVNFYMELTDATLADETAYMLFTLPNGETAKVYVKDVTKNGDYYQFTANIAVKEMADTITAKLVTANGDSAEYTYTVQQYAKYIIDNPASYSAEEIAVAKAMLNYGAYAQLMFNYHTDNLANSVLDAADRKLADVAIGEMYKKAYANGEGVTYLGTTTVWEANTYIRHYFNITGEDVTFTLDGVELEVHDSANGKYVEITGILAKDMATTYELVASNGTTVTCSVYSYFYDILNGGNSYTDAQKNAAKAAYIYSQAAITYLNNK